MEDIRLRCRDCKSWFVWTAVQQRAALGRDYKAPETPVYCERCRRARAQFEAWKASCDKEKTVSGGQTTGTEVTP